MGTIVSQEKNQKVVKIISWLLIVVSALVLFRSLFALQGYTAMITMQSITKKFNPSVGINFTLFFVQNAVELLLCIVLFVSATFVLKYRNQWRKVLVYGLIASIIFLMVSPIINYNNMPALKMASNGGIEKEMMNVAKTSILIWSYFWSIVLSTFFIVVIQKFSKEEVKLLFI